MEPSLLDRQRIVVPTNITCQCLGILIAGFKTEAGAIEIQIQLKILVAPAQAGWVQCKLQGKVVVVELTAHRPFPVGFQVGLHSMPTAIEVQPRQVSPSFQAYLSIRAFYISRVVVGSHIDLSQQAVSAIY